MARTTTDVRMKVLDAFVECVIELGIEKATYRAVAKRAQVGLGTVQHYFPKKSALINEALSVEHQRVRERQDVHDEAEEPRNLLQAMERRLARMLHLTPDERRMFPFYLEYWAHASRDPDLRLFHDRRWDQISSGMRDELTSGIKEESLHPVLDPGDLAAAIIALVYGLNTNITLHRSQYPDDRVLRIVRTVIAALLKYPESVEARSPFAESAAGVAAPTS